ncbi:PREDICTED: 5-hydroxytryptamine receptor 1D-like [Priapulus caudatus]|uniref:5-hydroxytryptamine receptor 1D-like n=1 Tax=Priapulus caudatus TaxID=37621 RepID=A0ABM1EGX4_PRICU|nr:PREDICTED: 5-hydroxytryptamine receptor 1D-like [Priapulus caudatus]
MLAISMDRLWSVTWSVHYRNNNTTRKTIAIISVVWLLDVILILPAMIVDRVREHPKWSDPTLPGFRYHCFWDPARNGVFIYSVMVIFIESSLPMIIICYVGVFYAVKKRAKMNGAAIWQASRSISTNFSNVASSSRTTEQERPTGDAVSAGVVVTSPRINSASASVGRPVPTTVVLAVVAGRRGGSRRTFVVLTYVVVPFIFCWGVFFVLLNVKVADPNSISDTTYTLLFWLPYFNSTLNPVLYGISNPEIRKVIRQILQCK